MSRVIAGLVRHGDYHQLADTPSAWQPFALNARGERQAREAVPGLRADLAAAGWSLDPRVECSRLLRAWQTAKILVDELPGSGPERFSISSHDALAERSVGSGANLTVAQIEAVLRDDPRFPPPPADWKSNSHYRLPLQGAESLLEAGERVAAHLESSLDVLEGPGDCVRLFVGHGAAFRHAAFHLGVLEFAQIAELSMYHCRPVFIERLAPGRWRHVGGDWKIRRQNERYID